MITRISYPHSTYRLGRLALDGPPSVSTSRAATSPAPSLFPLFRPLPQTSRQAGRPRARPPRLAPGLTSRQDSNPPTPVAQQPIPPGRSRRAPPPYKERSDPGPGARLRHCAESHGVACLPPSPVLPPMWAGPDRAHDRSAQQHPPETPTRATTARPSRKALTETRRPT